MTEIVSKTRNSDSQWLERPDTIERIARDLAEHTLDPIFEQYGDFCDRSPEWLTKEADEKYIGCVKFCGNFLEYSGVFNVITSDKEIIAKLTADAESGTPIGLGIAPGGDDRASLLQISNAIHKADHEARGIAEIVSKGRPQRCARRNRIARATKLGVALRYARLRTCDAASSAYNIASGSVAKPRREIRKSSRRWELVGQLPTGAMERGAIRVLIGQSACLARSTVCSPRIGCENRLI